MLLHKQGIKSEEEGAIFEIFVSKNCFPVTVAREGYIICVPHISFLVEFEGRR